MSKLKLSPNLFLEVAELENFRRLMVDEGYKAVFKSMVKNFGIASGYLWQREFAKSGNKNLHFLYLALNITIDSSDDKSYNFPGAD